MIIGDLNANINLSSVRSDSLFECLPSYRDVPKFHKYSYVLHPGSTSDINRIIFSPGFITSSASTNVNEQDTDHMPISVTFTMDIDVSETNCSWEKSKWFEKSNLSKANIPHYIFTLTALCSTIRVPYHPLQYQYLHMLKMILTVIVTDFWCVWKRYKKQPYLGNVFAKKHKTYLVNGPLFKVDKNKAKLWLNMWSECVLLKRKFWVYGWSQT